MPARERESIRFVLIPFSATPFRHPGYLSLAHNPGGSPAPGPHGGRFFPRSSQSTFSSLSTSTDATSAPRLASLRKQSRTPGPPAFATTSATFGFQLWLELPRRHLTPPFHDTVERFPRLFSPRLLRRPVPLFSHPRILQPLGRAATAFQITPRSPISFSLCSPFLLVRRSPAFFLLFFPRKWLTPPFTFLPPLPLICVVSCFFYISHPTVRFICTSAVDERARRTDSASEDEAKTRGAERQASRLD